MALLCILAQLRLEYSGSITCHWQALAIMQICNKVNPHLSELHLSENSPSEQIFQSPEQILIYRRTIYHF